jgi:hypothetical protein
MVAPFMPTKAQELWRQLGAPGNVDEFRWPSREAGESAEAGLDPSGWQVSKGAALFPREQPAPAR